MFTLNSSLRAETLKQIFNPAFGGGDFYTALSSTTLPSGSTFYIQDNGTGGLFEIGSSSPTTTVTGQLSATDVSGNAVLWLFAGGHRWRFDPVLDDPAGGAFILLEDGTFMLLEDGTKILTE